MEPTGPSQSNNNLNGSTPTPPKVSDPMVTPTENTKVNAFIPPTAPVVSESTPTEAASSPTVTPPRTSEVEAPALGTEPATVSAPTSPSPTPSSSTAGDAPSPSPIVSEPSVGQAMPSSPVAGGDGGGKKKWVLPAALGAGLVALLAGGYVFAVVLPNQPQTVFNKSLVQSGQAADKLVDYSKNYKSAKSSLMDGTLTVKAGGMDVDATLKGEASAKDAQLTLDATLAGKKVTADFRMLSNTASTAPDLYIKVAGIKQYAPSTPTSPLVTLDGQWIGIDHTLLESYQKQMAASTGTSATASLQAVPTTEQANDAVAKVQKVNKEYLFTTDKSKAVVTYKSFVGKETKNARTVNHYKAGYNKTNLSAYVDAVGKALDTSSLNDWSKKQQNGKNLSELLNIDKLKSSINKNKGDETFDVFVDTKTKLMQSVTFTGKESSGKGTLTFAQNYTGGDSYPFELALDSAESKVTLGLTTNTKTNAMQLKMNGVMSSSGSDTNIDMLMNITPSDKEVAITVPTGAKPLTDVMKQLGVNPDTVLGASTSQPSASVKM
ncbi:MAG: hypothetical protein WAQ24_00505 [Candidatus Saccharimonadales bacterium]